MNQSLFRCFVVLCALTATACAGETASDDVDVDVEAETPRIGLESSDIFLRVDGVVGEPTTPRTLIIR